MTVKVERANNGWWWVDGIIEGKFSQDQPGIQHHGAGYRKLHFTHMPLLTRATGWMYEHDHSCTNDGGHACAAWVSALRPYQREGAEKLNHAVHGLLADDLGLGKTRTALAAARFPLLIVAPKSAIQSVWMRELEMMYPMKGQMQWLKSSSDRIDATKDVFLVTYQLLPAFAGYFSASGVCRDLIHTLILDEAHFLTNAHVRYSQAAARPSRRQTIAITATPIRNRLSGLWGILNALHPGAWGNHLDFRRYYCGAVPDEYGHWQDGVPQHLDELKLRLGSFMVKRSRESVSVSCDLPELLTPMVLRVNIPPEQQAQIITTAAKGVVDRWTRAGGSGKHLAKMTAMRLALGLAKVKRLGEIPRIRQLLGHQHRIVWWVWHKDVAEALGEVLMEHGRGIPEYFTGDSTAKARLELLGDWRDGPKNVPRDLICTIPAGGASVDLTAAYLAVFVEMSWTPLDMLQAAKRTHRFGQTEICEEYHVVAANSFEDRMVEVLLDKATQSEAVFSDGMSLDAIQHILAMED